MELFIRAIGLKRAEAKITFAKLAYNIRRLLFHERRAAAGQVRSEARKYSEKQPNQAANRVTSASNQRNNVRCRQSSRLMEVPSYGLRRMRWCGIAKVGVQIHLTAIAYNLKQTLNIAQHVG